MSHRIGEKFDRVKMLHIDYENKQVGARVQRCVCTEEATGEIAEDVTVKAEDMVWYPWDEFLATLRTRIGPTLRPVQDELVTVFHAGRAEHEKKAAEAKAKK